MLSGRGICSTRAPPADEAGAENVGGIEDPSKKWPFKRFSLLKVGSSAHKHTLAYATTEQVHKGEEPEQGPLFTLPDIKHSIHVQSLKLNSDVVFSQQSTVN